MNEALIEKTTAAVSRFCGWLDRYGETSYDHQSFFASKLGRSAKALYYRKPLLGTLAVAPMVFCEAFVPSARTILLEAAAFSHRRRPLRHGFCVPREKSMEQTNITSEPFTSLRSCKRLAAEVMRTTAGDIRSTGRRERAL